MILAARFTLFGFGLFDQRLLADDHDDAGRSDVETATVGFGVIADFRMLGKADVAVDDGAADFGVATDVHVVVDDRILNVAEAVDADIVADNAAFHAATRENGARSNDGIDRGAHPVFISEDEFRGGILLLPGA